jgi:hypothetical protein
MAITNDLPASFAGLVRWLVVLSDWSDREWLNLRGPKHLECDIVIRSYSADSIRDRSDKLHTKSGCMAAIFTFSKLLIESLAKREASMYGHWKTKILLAMSQLVVEANTVI